MKLSKMLQIAVMVSLSVLNAAALSLTTDPDPDSYEPTVTPASPLSVRTTINWTMESS